MICKNCHAELTEGATFCGQCGCNLAETTPVAPVEPTPVAAPVAPVEPTPVAPVEPTPVANPYAAPAEPNPYAPPVANPYAAPVIPNPYYGVPYPAEAPAAPAPKKKKKGLVIGLIVAAVVIIAAVAVVIYLGGADGRTVDEARSLADEGEYLDALDLLDSIDDPSADVEKDINALQEEIYEGIGAYTMELLADDPSAALEYLREYDFIPNYDKILESVHEGMADEIYDLMDDGEYIKAQELLDEYDFLPSHDTLAAQIKYESFIIFAAFDYRDCLKNPDTMKLVSVELYDGWDDDAIYPTVVIYESAQNGYGNDVYSYEIFFGDDLTYAGSTTTLDTRETDYETVEYYVASIIITLRENKTFAVKDAVYDIDRINSFLATGDMPNIDITRYAGNI